MLDDSTIHQIHELAKEAVKRYKTSRDTQVIIDHGSNVRFAPILLNEVVDQVWSDHRHQLRGIGIAERHIQKAAEAIIPRIEEQEEERRVQAQRQNAKLVCRLAQRSREE